MDEEYQNWFNSLSPEQQAGATKFSGGGGSGMGNLHSQQITQGNFDAMVNPSLAGTTLTKSPPAPVMNNTTPAVDNFDMTKQMQLPQLMGPAGQPFQQQVEEGSPARLATEVLQQSFPPRDEGATDQHGTRGWRNYSGTW